jgi:hypothetical protein
MQIIKRYVNSKDKKSRRMIIRTDCYGSYFSHIKMLVGIAQEDFIMLDDEIEIVHYGGDRIRGIFGIEFNVTPESSVLDYREQFSVDPTL